MSVKFKTTKKEILGGYYHIVRIGYCEGDYLLRHLTPIAYSSGKYGWQCDYYHVDANTVVSTGYAPLADRYVNCDYPTVRYYNELAMEIVRNGTNWDEVKIRLAHNFSRFIEEVKRDA